MVPQVTYNFLLASEIKGQFETKSQMMFEAQGPELHRTSSDSLNKA